VVTFQESGYTRFEECLAGGSERLFSRLTAGVEPADVAFIQYTSGTTGDPKGVMLTHRNLVSQRKATEKIWEISPRSRFLSYLPWHHSYGGLSERFTVLYHGAAMYLEDSYGKDIHRLIENWGLAEPTHFFSVPKIYMALVTEAKLDARTQETLFHPGLRFVFTAAAPLPRECGEYFDARQVPVLEGWGMTETSPTVTVTPGDRKRVHSYVGDPIPGCEIRITGEDEILVRGPNVMKGYYKDPEKTARAVDSDGWLHTGDIGELTDLGLKLKYRRDGLFKLANGEKVSAVLVENALVNASPWISQAVVFGSGESFTAALLFPNFPRLEEWAADCHRDLPKGWELSADREIQELFRRDIEESMQELEPAYLRVKAFVVVPEELTVEKGQLTPSLKVVRHRVAKEYRDWVHAIYRPGKHPHRQACIVGGKDDAFYWKKN
jgi:long-subunit acyl-CoA synthetase (AMP-forming)